MWTGRARRRNIGPVAEPRTKVLGKAGKLLELLAANPGTTAPELAQLMAEPRPSVHRLVQDLVALGYVEPASRPGTYQLGLGLFRLGSVVASRLDVRERARPVMEEVHRALEETVYLVVRRGDDAVCIERVEGLHIRSMALQLGGSLPLHLGAGPRALLAFEPRESWDGYFQRATLEARTPRTPTTRAGLLALLEEARHRGYDISDEDVTVGIASVGAPVFDHTGSVRAALSVGGMRSALMDDGGEKAVKLVTEGAREVSRRLGFEP